MTQAQAKEYLNNAEEVQMEPPRPLRKAVASAEPFPITSMSKILAGGTQAIHEKVRAPEAICAQSVLAAASLAVQAHADVITPTGQRRPLSQFFLSVAATGERKTSCDDEAMWAIDQHEKHLRTIYDADYLIWKNAHDAWDQQRKNILKDGKIKTAEIRSDALNSIGDAPPPPLTPMLTCPEPTFEGLCKLLIDGQPSLGMFSSEGGQFIGGHGMSQDNKLKTVAAISCIWDGKPIKRVRAGDGSIILPGRRVSMHLMAQPGVAAQMLSDPVLADQGLLSRLLVSAPGSTAGTRFHRPVSQAVEEVLNQYNQHILGILQHPLPLAEGKRNELAPRGLPFNATAKKAMIGFSDHIERLCAAGGDLEPVRGLANKLAEHAARLAGVFALTDDLMIAEITEEHASGGITLAQYYAGEALRLFGEGGISRDILLAEKLLQWLHQTWQEPLISLPDIYQRSLNSISDKSTASRIVNLLEDHGWMIKLPQGAKIGDAFRRDVWRVVKG